MTRIVAHLWQKNMVAQIAVLVGLALLVAQAINGYFLLRGAARQELTQVTAPAIGRLVDVIERDALADPAERAEQAHGGRGRIGPQPLVTAAMRPRADVAERARTAARDFRLNVRQLLAAETNEFPLETSKRYAEVRNTIDPQGEIDSRPYLVLSAQVAPDRWISVVSRLPDRNPRLIFWVLAQTLLFYGIVMVPVVWLMRRLSRPLRTLTRAVEQFRSAESSADVAESGPEDVRRLIAAYNGMRTRLVSLLDEKDRMLGAIGHDLRTPLASLRVRAESVEDEVERDRMAATIEEMSRTLDDILSLARLGHPGEPETKVDIAALVDQVADDFQALGADVVIADAPRTTAVIRPILITRAVRNLIENAVKYGQSARVGISSDDRGVSVTVDDAGPGIPEDRIEAMFEPFTRLEQSRSRETGGAGLGLALAKAIALQHGGALTLRNRPEGGLRATLWLPA